MHHYRSDETDVLYGPGTPTASVERPTLYLETTTQRIYLNRGGGTTWSLTGGAATGMGSVLTTATVLTVLDHGKTFWLASAGGFDVTTPALAAAPGFFCRFKVLVAPTTAYTITGATADKMIGHVLSSSGAAEDHEDTAGGDVLTFVANTSVIGDEATLEIDPSSNYYLVSAKCAVAGGITITG